MALSPLEVSAFFRVGATIATRAPYDQKLMRYYRGRQRLTYLGIAVPPEMRFMETIVNWPRTTVDSLVQRLKIRSLFLPGEATASPMLQEGWDVNNLESRLRMAFKDALVLGRGVVSVGKNEDDPDHPLITVESPNEVAIEVDQRTGKRLWGVRLYGQTADSAGPRYGTLYSPDSTSWLELDSSSGKWVEVDRDDHALGQLPLVPLVNRELSWDPCGESEMADVLPLTDGAARSLTNLQIAQESHALPPRYVLGMSKGDFVNKAGEPIPQWEAYFTSFMATANKDATIGQLTQSSLDNFHNTVNHYAQLVSGLTGLPMRYLGQVSTNPPSADGIRADESRVVANSEDKQLSWGDPIGEIGALYLLLKGVEVDGRLIKTQWFDAGTPTYSAKVDGIQKLTGGKPVLSIEGGWDELGWSEARKAQERQYFEDEQSDPTLEKIVAGLVPNSGIPAGG